MKRLLVISLLSLLAVSCEDFLEETPDRLTPENFPASPEEVRLLMGSSFNELHNSGGYFERASMYINEIAADNAGARRTIGHPVGDLKSYAFRADNAEITRAYERLYIAINEMNFIISPLESRRDESWVPPYLGAAKAFRAYLYHDLVQLFGPIPLVTEPIESVEETQAATRTPITEVYDQIIGDLEDAEGLLEGHVWSERASIPNQAFAKATLARVYMTMAGEPLNQSERWAQAAQKAQEIIDMGQYVLLDNYADLWTLENKNNTEIILAGQRSMEGNDTRSLLNRRTRPRDGTPLQGSGTINTNIEYYNKFSPDDERRDATVSLFTVNTLVTPADTIWYTEYRGGNINEATPHYSKFWDSDRPDEDWNDQGRRNSNAVPIFRYAEVLLMLAESINEAQGPTMAAYDAINRVRARAGLTALNGLTQEEFRAAVRLERELEFGVEGKRRFDLVRWGTLIQVMQNDQFAGSNIQDFHVLLPIPLNEFNLSPNLGEQNFGYGGE